MGTFVTGPDPLPALKIDRPGYPPTGLAYEFDAVDYNSIWAALSDCRTAIASAGITAQRTVIADANYQALSTDSLVAYSSLTAPRTVLLPAPSARLGQEITIKDESGSAGTYPITIGGVGGATNLILQSQALATSPWVIAQDYSGTTISNNTTDVTDPLGGNTASKMTTEDTRTGSTYSVIRQTPTLAAGTYTLSAWMRTLSGTTQQHLAGGSFLTVTSTWTRFSHTFTATAGTNYIDIGVNRFDPAQTAGSAAATLYLWGVQLETGSTVNAYVPTTTSSASGSSFTIDGLSSITLGNAYEAVFLYSNGTNWFTAAALPVYALAGDVTGPLGSSVVARVGGSTASLVHSAELLANAATSANTANALVKRDGTGNVAVQSVTTAGKRTDSGTTDQSGSPGAATQNSATGKSAIASGASSVVITNALCTVNSLVMAWVQQSAADATLTAVVRTSAASGSFTLYGNAASTAAVVVGWEIVN